MSWLNIIEKMWCQMWDVRWMEKRHTEAVSIRGWKWDAGPTESLQESRHCPHTCEPVPKSFVTWWCNEVSCRLWQIIVSFAIWKGKMSTSKWFNQVWSIFIWQFPKSCWLPGTPPSRWCWIPSSLTRLLISSLTMKPFEVAVASCCQSIQESMPHSVTALNSTALQRSWVGFLCLGQWLLSLDDQMASCQSRGGVFQSHWKRLKGKGY